MISFYLLLLAACTPLVCSSMSRPAGLEDGPGQDPAPGPDPLENVQVLLAKQITILSALWSQAAASHHTKSHGVAVADQKSPNTILDHSSISPGIQVPLDGQFEGKQELHLTSMSPDTMKTPREPKESLPVIPIPSQWARSVSLKDCDYCSPVPDRAECRRRCGVSFQAPWPKEKTVNTSLEVLDGRGSPMAVNALVDLVLFPSFISANLVHGLGLESNVKPWPPVCPAEKDPEATVRIVGTVHITLASFTKGKFKYEDVYYVYEPFGSSEGFPDLTVGVEILRQIRGLAVHPDVIV